MNNLFSSAMESELVTQFRALRASNIAQRMIEATVVRQAFPASVERQDLKATILRAPTLATFRMSLTARRITFVAWTKPELDLKRLKFRVLVEMFSIQTRRVFAPEEASSTTASHTVVPMLRHWLTVS